MKNLLVVLFIVIRFTSLAGTNPFQFLAPLPGSKGHDVNRNVVLREGRLLLASSITADRFEITGSKSGIHDVTIRLADDGKTVVLLPVRPFTYNEEVHVSVKQGIETIDGDFIGSFSYSFFTHRRYTDAEQEDFRRAKYVLLRQELLREGIDTNAMSDAGDARDLADCITIDVNDNPSPGEIFFDAVNTSVSNPQCMGYFIIKPDGQTVFSHSTTIPYFDDFKITQRGYLSVFNYAEQQIEVLDSNFHLIRKFKPTNGYTADNHEFLLTEDGHALLIAEEDQVVDMTVYDPSYSSNATVLGTVIQEFDASRNLVFEWRSFDHVDITEGLHENLTYSFIDYCHTNSIDIDADGNLIVSHRHLDQVTKIDRNTGEFIWRLGGVKNEFTFLNEPEPFTYQHDARRIENGNLTLYDNGDFHPVKRSYAKEYALDEVNKTATLVWSYAHPDVNGKPVYFFATGSVQRLPDGNTFIDGGYDTFMDDQPNFWEVTPDGTIIWQLTLHETKNVVSYRARKFDWNPCARPTARLMKTSDITSHTAKLTWNEATNATLYLVQVHEKGTDNWQQLLTSIPSKTISGLLPNTWYEWRIKSSCTDPDTVSGFSEPKSFKTLDARSELAEYEMIADVFPNPAADVVTISLHESAEVSYSVRIVNLPGDVLFDSGKISGDLPLEIPVSDFANGIYFLEIMANDRVTYYKLAIQ